MMPVMLGEGAVQEYVSMSLMFTSRRWSSVELLDTYMYNTCTSHNTNTAYCRRMSVTAFTLPCWTYVYI